MRDPPVTPRFAILLISLVNFTTPQFIAVLLLPSLVCRKQTRRDITFTMEAAWFTEDRQP